MSPAEQLVEAERLARRPRRARLLGPPHLLDRAGGGYRLGAGVDPLVEGLAVHLEAEDRRRVPGLGRPELGLLGLGRSLDQRELGDRRAEIEARAADHDRPPPRRQRLIDLAVRPPHVVADRERLGDRHKPDQPVLEPRLLLSRRGAGQPFEALVDLQRIAGNSHRILTPLPKLVSKSDRDPGLPDPGRPKYGDSRSYGVSAKPRTACTFSAIRPRPAASLITEKVERGALPTPHSTSAT